MPKHEMKLMWDRFDADKSGTICMQEFVTELTRSVATKEGKVFANFERAARNVICLRDFLRCKNISAESIFSKTKLKEMRYEDFNPFIKTINYRISEVEIEDMFKYIDRNDSGLIELTEFRNVL